MEVQIGKTFATPSYIKPDKPAAPHGDIARDAVHSESASVPVPDKRTPKLLIRLAPYGAKHAC